VMAIQTYRESEHRGRFPAMLAGTVKRAEPAEVILKIVGGDSSEPSDPRLKSTVIRVDVLDVPGAAHRSPALRFSGSCCRAMSCAAAAVAAEPSVHRMASL